MYCATSSNEPMYCTYYSLCTVLLVGMSLCTVHTIAYVLYIVLRVHVTVRIGCKGGQVTSRRRQV